MRRRGQKTKPNKQRAANAKVEGSGTSAIDTLSINTDRSTDGLVDSNINVCVTAVAVNVSLVMNRYGFEPPTAAVS